MKTKSTTVTPKPDVRNANTGTKAGREMLKHSVESLGYGRSILVDNDNNIIAGNKTFKEANEQGIETVRVIETDGSELIAVKRTDLNLYEDPKARELAFADNRTAETNLTWDPTIITEDFHDQRLDIGWMFEQEIKQFKKMQELTDRPITMDEQRETQVFTIDFPEFSHGDIITCLSQKVTKPHVLIYGDAREKATYDALFDVAGHIDCTITSPPYSNQREYDGLTADDLTPESLAQFLTQFLTHTAKHIPYAVVNLGLQMRHGEVFDYWEVYKQAAKQSGYKLLAWNVWDRLKPGSINAQTAPMFPLEHEWIFVFGHTRKEINRTVPCSHYEQSIERAAGKTGFTPQRDPDGTLALTTYPVHEFRKLPSVLRQLPVPGTRKYSHSAPFPVELPYDYILALTDPQETVLDPFVGSGSTFAAAEMASRRCCGIDISQECIKTTLQQWLDTAHTDALSISVNGTPIHFMQEDTS